MLYLKLILRSYLVWDADNVYDVMSAFALDPADVPQHLRVVEVVYIWQSRVVPLDGVLVVPDEVSFEDAWWKKEAGGPDWFLSDDTNIWPPPDGGWPCRAPSWLFFPTFVFLFIKSNLLPVQFSDDTSIPVYTCMSSSKLIITLQFHFNYTLITNEGKYQPFSNK